MYRAAAFARVQVRAWMVRSEDSVVRGEESMSGPDSVAGEGSISGMDTAQAPRTH